MKKIPAPLKKAAIWLDHHEAKLIIPGPPLQMTETIFSNIDSRPREDGESSDKTQVGRNRSSNNEHTKNEKEIRLLKAFFTRVATAIAAYDEILVFGPTTAGEEFINHLQRSKKFAGKQVRLQHTDYQTEKQRLAFVKKQLA